jgi:hypothetical protein
VSGTDASPPTISPLTKLIDSEIMSEASRPREAILVAVDDPIAATALETAPAVFERVAINFLAEYREALGITRVWRCRNARIDALVELTDGRRLAVEVKLRMNWEKACQACAQIGWYRTRGNPIDGGLVIFEEFTADWARQKTGWRAEPGWSYFYTDHHRVEGVRVDLLRLRDGKLESFVDARASDGAPATRAPGRAAHLGGAADLADVTRPGVEPVPAADDVAPSTLAEMGFAIRDECDQTANTWRFIAAGAPFLVPSPNGLHIRGIRHYIALIETARPSADSKFVACTITKSYASGGSEGSLEIIGGAGSLSKAVAGSNRRLREWLADDEVYSSELQPIEPAPLDAAGIESALANGRALFMGDWADIDHEAESRYSDLDVRWTKPGEPVLLYCA